MALERSWGRFCALVDVDGPVPLERPELGPCWVWTGHHTKDGYATFGSMLAHVWLYEQVHGGVPNRRRQTVDHLCRTRNCVNLLHLHRGPHRDNVLAGRGRAAANATKTRCPADHPYDEANTYVDPSSGKRKCRTCMREASRRYLRTERGRATNRAKRARQRIRCP